MMQVKVTQKTNFATQINQAKMLILQQFSTWSHVDVSAVSSKLLSVSKMSAVALTLL